MPAMTALGTFLSGPRALDHCVLPVETLDATRSRLSTLGFQVAPDARHPFGTENACVFFADGTYMEPLAVGDHDRYERAAQKGNVFVARDRAHRFRNGENGLSAMVVRTDKADADHARFRAEGLSAGRKLLFGRTLTDAAGNKARATFKLAFAADLRSPDSFFFACERVNAPAVDRSSLEVHPNGVAGIAEVIASETIPADIQDIGRTVMSNPDVQVDQAGISIAGDGFRFSILTPESLRVRFGVERATSRRGLRFEGIVFRVGDPVALRAVFEAGGVSTRDQGSHLVVDPAPGQGAFFAFEMSGANT